MGWDGIAARASKPERWWAAVGRMGQVSESLYCSPGDLQRASPSRQEHNEESARPNGRWVPDMKNVSHQDA